MSLSATATDSSSRAAFAPRHRRRSLAPCQVTPPPDRRHTTPASGYIIPSQWGEAVARLSQEPCETLRFPEGNVGAVMCSLKGDCSDAGISAGAGGGKVRSDADDREDAATRRDNPAARVSGCAGVEDGANAFFWDGVQAGDGNAGRVWTRVGRRRGRR